MKFYTYIGLLKNQIYVRELKGEEECSFSENFHPTMYTTVPSRVVYLHFSDGAVVYMVG
jgi:hypothetical protein